MPYILDVPTELLRLILTEASEPEPESKSYGLRLRDLRLLCRAFNNTIVPILFSHITIDMKGRIGPSTIQIDQLSRSREDGCAYRVVQTLDIRTLDVEHPRSSVIDQGLSTAVRALVSLQEVRWTIGPADSAARVGAVIEGLCALPPDLDLSVRVEFAAYSMHPQLIRLNAHLTRLSIATFWASSVLFTPQPKYMEVFAALVAGSPRLEHLEFHLPTGALAEDLDLDLVFGTLPSNRTCPPHLVLDGFRLRLGNTVHRLHNLQSLTLFIPRLRSDARENDAWLVPIWDALSAAGVFPPHIVANDLNDGLLGYLEQHPGLDKLALHTMRDSRRLRLNTRDQNALVGDFLSTALPRHVHTLRHLCIELMDPHNEVLNGYAITQCVLLETFATHIAWIDPQDFSTTFDKLLLLLSAIPDMQRATLTVGITRMIQVGAYLRTDVDRWVWDTVAARVLDEAMCVPKEIVVRGHLFCLGSVEGARRYVDEGPLVK